MKASPISHERANYRHLSHQLNLYFNHYPTLCGLKSWAGSLASISLHINPQATMTLPVEGVLRYPGTDFRKLHNAFVSLPVQYQRALRLLYDNTYRYHPGIDQDNKEPRQTTVIGYHLQFFEKLYGIKAPLVMMNTLINDWQKLRNLHNHKLSRFLTPSEHQLLFQIGNEVRQLYHACHLAFEKALTCH